MNLIIHNYSLWPSDPSPFLLLATSDRVLISHKVLPLLDPFPFPSFRRFLSSLNSLCLESGTYSALGNEKHAAAPFYSCQDNCCCIQELLLMRIGTLHTFFSPFLRFTDFRLAQHFLSTITHNFLPTLVFF